jgi:hypothetical protein
MRPGLRFFWEKVLHGWNLPMTPKEGELGHFYHLVQMYRKCRRQRVKVKNPQSRVKNCNKTLCNKWNWPLFPLPNFYIRKRMFLFNSEKEKGVLLLYLNIIYMRLTAHQQKTNGRTKEWMNWVMYNFWREIKLY